LPTAQTLSQAQLHADTVVLPEHPLVTRVTCTVSTLTVYMRDAAACESWQPDKTIMASAVAPFLCPDPVTGEDGPFVRKLTSVLAVRVGSRVNGAPAFEYDASEADVPEFAYSPALAERAGAITFSTVDVAPAAAFSTLQLSWQPGMPRALIQLQQLRLRDAQLADELLRLAQEARADMSAFTNNGTFDVPTVLERQLAARSIPRRVIDPPTPPRSVPSRIGRAAASAVTVLAVFTDLLDLPDFFNGKLELLKWSGTQPLYSSGGVWLQCKDCRIHVTARPRVDITANAQSLLSAEVSIEGMVSYAYSVAGAITSTPPCIAPTIKPVQVASHTLPRSITVRGVKITLKLTTRLHLEVGFRATGSGQFRSPVVTYQRDVKYGARYDGRWRLIQEVGTTHSVSSPTYKFGGALQVTATPVLSAKAEVWDMWDVTVTLRPTFTFRAFTAIKSPCVAARAADAHELKACPNKVRSDVWLTTRLDVTGSEARIPVSILGYKVFTIYIGKPSSLDVALIDKRLWGDCVRLATSMRMLQPAVSCAPSGCHYVPGNWSVCPVTCGVGIQSRPMACETTAGVALEVDECGATAGLSVPSSSQSCDVACASLGYAHGSLGTTFTSPSAPISLELSGIAVGQRLPFGRVFTVPFVTPTYLVGGDPGLFVGVTSVHPSNGDADVALSLPSRTQSSIRFGPVTDSLTATAEWGLGSNVAGVVRVSTYDPRITMAAARYTPPAASSTNHVLKVIPVRCWQGYAH